MAGSISSARCIVIYMMDMLSHIKITSVVDFGRGVGGWLNQCQKVNTNIDDLVISSNGFGKYKQMLVKEYGISEKQITDKTAVFFLPGNSNTGSVSIDGVVPTGGLADTNYLFQKGYLHCRNDFERFYFWESHRRLMSGCIILKYMKDYFGKRAMIVGVDINPECKSFEEEG